MQKCPFSGTLHSSEFFGPHCPCGEPSDSHGSCPLGQQSHLRLCQTCTGQRGCRALGRKVLENCIFHTLNLSLQLILAHPTHLPGSSDPSRRQDVLHAVPERGQGTSCAAQIGKGRAVAPATCLSVWPCYGHSVAL